MPVTIDATVGGVNANSYVTLAAAEAHFDERLNTGDWDGAANDEEKKKALIQATRRLDQIDWDGRKFEDDQALQWPRSGTTDRDGWAFETDEIPPEIKRATYELALAMLAEDLLVDSGLEGFERLAVGPLDITPRHTREAGELPAHVWREIEHLVGLGRANVRVLRG